jgi:hypothetical protein
MSDSEDSEDPEKDRVYNEICWKGNWTLLPQSCTGRVEVWDQTVGCPACGMNLWHLPAPGQWPTWDPNTPPEDWYQRCKQTGENEYTPFMNLFSLLHPEPWDIPDPEDNIGP